MPIIRFGDGSRVFNFAQLSLVLNEYDDNFGDVVPRTMRLPGQDGGFDEFGWDAAPQEIGKVTQRLYLASNTRAGMTTLRDNLRAMLSWGVRRLFLQLPDEVSERWCYARLHNIMMPQQPHEYTDLHQPVTLIWQVSAPRWLSGGAESAAVWGGSSLWGAATWGSSTTVVGSLTTFNVTNNGNAPTLCRIYLTTGAAQSMTNVKVERLVNSIVTDDSVQFNAAMLPNSVLEINAQAKYCRLNGANAYALLSVLRPRWFTLTPGVNAIRVTMNAGGAGTIRLAYHNTYY